MSQLLAGRMAVFSQQVHPGDACRVEVRAGQLLQIASVSGKQVSDFIAFGSGDTNEAISTAITRGMNGSIMLKTGSKVYSNLRNAMFELVEDRVGRHDLLFPACDPQRYALDFGLSDHPSCKAAFAAALEEDGVAFERIPDPINWFMNVGILQRGDLEIRESLAERGDFVMLAAQMDCIAVISACPQDQNATNGGSPTDILIRVFK